MEISPTEREDFVTVVKRSGYKEGDFELRAVEHPRPVGIPPEVSAPVRGEMTVRHKPSGINRRYTCGHMTNWIVEFEKDIAAGTYRPLQGRGLSAGTKRIEFSSK